MLKPEFMKISMDIAEGISRRIEVLHDSGVSYADLWADFSNNTQMFNLDSLENVNQEDFSFQYDAATFVVLSSLLADKYMEMQEGWEYDRTDHRWVKKGDPVPPAQMPFIRWSMPPVK